MFTNQKFLGILIILLVFGASIYIAMTKFKQDVFETTASPSPTPGELSFTLTRTPAPSGQSQPTDLPLSKNKHLDKFPGIIRGDLLQNKKVSIQTKKGIISLEIYPEASAAASNFLVLAANGFYDGLTFHRVEPGFVIQGGDPAGDGTGGPGYQFPDEPVVRDYTKGTLAMANSGPNTNGSQFFIMLEDNPTLPKNYTIFGKVIVGQEVVDQIQVGDIMQQVIVQNLH